MVDYSVLFLLNVTMLPYEFPSSIKDAEFFAQLGELGSMELGKSKSKAVPLCRVGGKGRGSIAPTHSWPWH
jgi:hypothetical protein